MNATAAQLSPCPKADILIVDDQPNNLRLLSLMLTQQGYKVRKATSGELALQAVSAVQPDLILLDIMMPGIGGLEVCRMLKSQTQTQEIPVIFLSALDATEVKVRAFQLGGCDYITKPFQQEEVLARVAHQVTLRQQQQQLQHRYRELQTSEARYQELFDQVNEAVWRATPTGQYLEVNPAYARMLGYDSPAEVLAEIQDIAQQLYVEPTCRQEFQQQMHTAGTVTKLEVQFRRRDGSIGWGLESARPVYDHDGRLFCYEGITTDITQRKQAELALEARERYLAALVEIQQMLLEFDGDLPTLYARILPILGPAATACRAYLIKCSHRQGRYALQEAASWCSPNLDYHPRSASFTNLTDTNFPQVWLSQLAQGQVVSALVEDLPPEAQESLYDRGVLAVLAFPLQVQGEFFGFIGFDNCHAKQLWDQARLHLLQSAATTLALALERQQSEVDLRASELRFRNLFEAIPDVAVQGYDRHHRVIFWNHASEQLYGLTKAEALGQRLDKLFFAPQFLPEVSHTLTALLQGKVALPFSDELEITRQNGSRVTVYSRNVRLENAFGKPEIYFLSIDISERKLAEAQIQAALREKTALLQEVYHRVKNNLQVVCSLLRLQMKRISEPQLQAILEDSHSRVMAMSLVHQSLYQSDNFAQVDLGKYIRSLCTQLFSSFGILPTQICLDLQAEVETAVPLDKAVPCGLILNELITNALKHGFAGGQLAGELRVELHAPDPQRLMLKVSNNGVPLPDNFCPEAYRSMGLKLVQLLCDQLNGQMSVLPGEITTFQVSFAID